MHQKFLKGAALAALVTGLGACNGSSGDSNDGLFVAGIWTGAFSVVENECALVVPQAVNFTHTVNQNEEAVLLQTDTGQQYVGNILSDQGFSVDNTGDQDSSIGGGVTCDFLNRIEYDGIFEDEDNDADAELRITRTCSNNTTCLVRYAGTARRNAGAVPTPGATPTAVGTPLPAGACTSMQERSYSGDEGCGIGEISLDQASSSGSSTVVLEPFGVNGATSFVVDAANNSNAGSARSDLQIKGDIGYSCSLSCNPPITFTVDCFKEGATSCTERF